MKAGPILTVDALIVKDNKILLAKRKIDPFKDYFVLPGGKVKEGEKTRDAIKREVKEESNIDIEVVATLGIYDDPKRDPRGHYISIAFICAYLGNEAKESNELKDFEWVSLKDIDKYNIGFDHKKMIDTYKAIMSLSKKK